MPGGGETSFGGYPQPKTMPEITGAGLAFNQQKGDNMRVEVKTVDGGYGCSEQDGNEDVTHALEVFSAALHAAGFGVYKFSIDREEDDE